jgi:hypothetical protein
MRQPTTGEHRIPVHRVPLSIRLKSWNHGGQAWRIRRQVENVLFVVVLLALFGSVAKRSHRAHQGRLQQSCEQR